MTANKPSTEQDIIIIGAGHNGLVAAFYLARAGLRVLVLEAKPLIGGSCITEELLPGYRFSSCANALWAFRPKIAADMGLFRRGLEVRTRLAVRLQPDGRSLVSGVIGPGSGRSAIEEFQAEVSRFSKADADAFPRWHEFVSRLSRLFGPFLLQNPPSLERIEAACRDGGDRAALDAIMKHSLADLADRHFESEVMRDVGVGADMGDVREPGSALLFALMSAMGEYTENGEPVASGFVRGGMGRLSRLMAEAAEESGAVIRANAPVRRLAVRNGRAAGVELESGEVLTCRAVISNADPKRTFLSLVPPNELNEGFLGRIRGLQTHAAAGMKFHCALSEMPEFLTDRAFSAEEMSRALFVITPNREYRLEAWRAALAGRLPDAPVISGSFPSLFDPSLAPPGKFTMSTYILWAPVRPGEGAWQSRKKEMAEIIIRTLERQVRNFRRSLVDYVLLTPADIEERNFLSDGNIHHIDGIPSQLLRRRPLEELADYRTPIAGFYLCGAGTHPWGEISGAPGHNAAQVVLADFRISSNNPSTPHA